MFMNNTLDQRPSVGKRRNAMMMTIKNTLLALGMATVAFSGLFAQSTNATEHPLLNTDQLDGQRWFYNLDSALANPDKVYKLSLIDQQIKSLPPEIGSLRNLQVLNLSNTKLKEIPLEIKECKNLQIISLYGNKLKYIPTEMRELKQLEILYLGKNKLFEVPQWLGTMTKIRRLDISHNPLTPADVSNAKRMLPKADVTF